MRLNLIFRIAFLAAAVAGCATHDHLQVVAINPTMATLTEVVGKPAASGAKLVVLNKKYFEVYYQPDFRLAKYVRYTLTADQVRHKAGKRGNNKFIADPELTAMNLKAVTDQEYPKGSGYDRGHLAPAEDFRYSQEAVDSTFMLSNVVPQKPGLNRGLWKRLENKVRRWACGEEKITVFSGPILGDDIKKLKTGLAVPEEFFKLIIDETPPRKTRAYIVKQDDRGNILDQRIVSLDHLQERIHEDLVFGADKAMREPSQENQWKEKDCK